MTLVAEVPRNQTGLPSTAGQEERDRARQLIDNGRVAMAVIRSVSDTGVRVDGGTVAEVHLLVECPGAEPYPVTRRAVLPAAERATGPGLTGLTHARVPRQLRPRVPVLVDPTQPDNVLLRWDLRPAG
ncbi:hypothetical protein [Frankia sp. EI5c]|uniref:hypothetical protein n=1 Tax=Frankia sp. EI5c TaxID=683316 RepID=UPI000824B01C|nr:hypothetical protein [Frankia sp. EI5c]